MAIQQLLQSRQSGLPPGTQLGIVANEIAQSGQYKPFTSDGRPTVVKNLIDQESQKDAAKQAALAGQIQAQKEAEIMNAIRQMAAQQTERPVMAARGGIITLPADVNMAEGGIVGYNGDTESLVRSPEETVSSEEAAALDELRVAEAKRKRNEAERRRQAEFLRLAGAPQAAQYEEGAPATYESMKDTRQVPPGRYAEPAPTQRPAASAPTASAAPSGVIDYVDFLNKMLGAQTEGFRKSEELEKPLPKTAEEERYTREHEAETARREADIEARRQRYLATEQERAKTGQPTKLQELADFLSNVGGARSLFAGLGQATRIQTGIDAVRRKEAQAAIDRRQQYFELLDRERDAIKDRNEALRLNQMDRARAEQEKIRQIQIDKNKLRIQSATQMFGPALQAAQHAQSTAQQITSREKMARERNAALVASALAKGANKPVPGMGIGDLEKLNTMIAAEFAPSRLGSDARRIISGMPNGEQLLRDIDNGNIDLNKEAGRAKAAPILARAKELYKQSLLGQTKYGAQPMSYSAAASAAGLEDEED